MFKVNNKKPERRHFFSEKVMLAGNELKHQIWMDVVNAELDLKL